MFFNELYPSIFLTPFSINVLYLFSISFTAHFNAIAANLGSIITGTSKCGIPLYGISSTILGSTIMNFTSRSDFFVIKVDINVLTATLFPDPVCPAINRCGIFAISIILSLPTISFPSIIFNAPFSNSLFLIIFEK